jgi:hypothetical protein
VVGGRSEPELAEEGLELAEDALGSDSVDVPEPGPADSEPAGSLVGELPGTEVGGLPPGFPADGPPITDETGELGGAPDGPPTTDEPGELGGEPDGLPTTDEPGELGGALDAPGEPVGEPAPPGPATLELREPELEAVRTDVTTEVGTPEAGRPPEPGPEGAEPEGNPGGTGTPEPPTATVLTIVRRDVGVPEVPPIVSTMVTAE